MQQPNAMRLITYENGCKHRMTIFSMCSRLEPLEPQFVVTSAVSDQYRFKDELRQYPLTTTRVNQEHKSKRRSGHELVQLRKMQFLTVVDGSLWIALDLERGPPQAGP